MITGTYCKLLVKPKFVWAREMICLAVSTGMESFDPAAHAAFKLSQILLLVTDLPYTFDQASMQGDHNKSPIIFLLTNSLLTLLG